MFFEHGVPEKRILNWVNDGLELSFFDVLPDQPVCGHHFAGALW